MQIKKGILEGIRILDLSRMLSGPYATMMFSDHGAEVIKVEDIHGDSSRRSGPFRKDDEHKEWAGYFVSLNRNKKSVSLNLKNDADKSHFKELVKTVDILIENFRPGVMKRLGFSFNHLKEINPQLVYGSITGFGLKEFGESPYSNWPSYDVVAQAMGGLISLTGFDDENLLKVGPGVADIFSGSLMSFGLLAALIKAKKTGVGQLVEISMYDAIISMCERAIYQFDLTGKVPKPDGNGHPLLAPFGIYKASDGFIAIGIVEDSYWNVLKNIVLDKRFLDDTKYGTISLRAKNRYLLNSILNEWTVKYKKNDLLKLLGGKVPFGPVNDASEIFNDAHVKKRKSVIEIEHFKPNLSPWRVAANPVRFEGYGLKLNRPPKLGEHNKQLLPKTRNDKKNKNRERQKYFSSSHRCYLHCQDSKKNQLLVICDSFNWIERKFSYLTCLIEGNNLNNAKVTNAKELRFFFLDERNLEQIKYLENLVKSSDFSEKHLKTFDVFLGKNNKIEEFGKDLIVISQINK